jgi:hypothetical protein
VAAFTILGAIYADVTSNDCDLPRVVGSRVAVVGVANHSAAGDPCSSGCVPDCFSCSRSEEPALTSLASAPRIIVTAFVEPETRTSAGVLRLPYRPPLDLL